MGLTGQARKYELIDTDIVTTPDGRTLKRIRSLVVIAAMSVAPGDLGGYVESDTSLSHDGNAWVSDNAWVYGNARVSGNAWVSDNARVSDNAWVSGNARVSNNAWVSDNARVSGNAWVSGKAWVSDNARVSGNERVSGNARVSPVQITGLRWPVTICDHVMTIGCQTHALSAWEAFSDGEIEAMDGPDALQFWRSNKDALLALARGAGRSFEAAVDPAESEQ